MKGLVTLPCNADGPGQVSSLTSIPQLIINGTYLCFIFCCFCMSNQKSISFNAAIFTFVELSLAVPMVNSLTLVITLVVGSFFGERINKSKYLCPYLLQRLTIRNSSTQLNHLVQHLLNKLHKQAGVASQLYNAIPLSQCCLNFVNLRNNEQHKLGLHT